MASLVVRNHTSLDISCTDSGKGTERRDGELSIPWKEPEPLLLSNTIRLH